MPDLRARPTMHRWQRRHLAALLHRNIDETAGHHDSATRLGNVEKNVAQIHPNSRQIDKLMHSGTGLRQSSILFVEEPLHSLLPVSSPFDDRAVYGVTQSMRLRLPFLDEPKPLAHDLAGRTATAAFNGAIDEAFSTPAYGHVHAVSSGVPKETSVANFALYVLL